MTDYISNNIIKLDNLFRLDGRIALVTGAAGHLGRSISFALAEAGAHVYLNGRSAEKLTELHEELQVNGYKSTVVSSDVTNESEIKKTLVRIDNEYGRLDILVNNAYAGRSSTFEKSTLNDFQNSYLVTVTAAFLLMQYALPLMKKVPELNSAGASVINIASMYGIVSPDPSIYGDSGANNPPFYGAAKAGLIQLTKYAACHLANHSIRVNSISPGPFPEPDIKSKNMEFYKELCGKNPMRRIGYADELKGPILFLASDASSFVTGINLPVDGGWTSW